MTMTAAVQTNSSPATALARTATGDRSRLEYLDAVRGLAALSVIVFHFMQAYGEPPGGWIWTRTPLAMFCDGQAAVSLFFVLSGLVLSLRFFREAPNGGLGEFRFTPYLWARICRLWLPYLAVFVVVALIPRAPFQRLNTVPSPTSWMDFLYAPYPHTLSFYARDASLFKLFQPTLIPQGWTLSVEMILSLLVPAAVLVARRSSGWLLVVMVLAVWSMKASPFVFHFSLGILLAKHLPQIKAMLERKPAATFAVGITGILLYTSRSTVSYEQRVDWQTWWVWCITGTGAAAIIQVITVSRFMQGFLSLPALRYIGKLSYGTYLIHMQVLAVLTPLFLGRLAPVGQRGAWCLGLIFTMGVTVLLAAPFHSLIEMPSIALGKSWGRRMSGRSSEPARVRAMPNGGDPR